MKTERLKEGRLDILRFHLIDGYIDRFMGDLIDDPNSTTSSNVSLNTISTWYRLNSKTCWLHSSDIRDIVKNMTEFNEVFTAEKIWKYTLQNE